MASVLKQSYFQNEKAAYAKLECIIWLNGPVCPHRGGVGRIGTMKGNATRLGLKKCYQCRKQFRATVGTVFEGSHIKPHMWLQAAYLMCSSKKDISSDQMARTLGVTVKTRRFVTHRLREAMRGDALPIVGGSGSIVEVDETFIGKKEGARVNALLGQIVGRLTYRALIA